MMTNKEVPNEENEGNLDDELLFFDTFTHESDVLNLDLVQFPKPVIVTEIRVIPLGAKVTADFHGGRFLLGATNPSQFHLEFFVNDLLEPGACTFIPLGTLNYKENGNINIVCEKKIPTDGLILRGFYGTITLAVYGVLTQVSPDQPPTDHSSGSGVQQELIKRTLSEDGYDKVQVQNNKDDKDHEWAKDNRGRRESRDRHVKENDKRDSRSRDRSRERDRRDRRESRDRDRRERHRGRHSRTHTPERSSSRRSSTDKPADQETRKVKEEAEAVSEEEHEEGNTTPADTQMEEGAEPEDYEEIVSEDETHMEFDIDLVEAEYDEQYKSFNPYVAEMQPLTYLHDPALTEFEIETRRLNNIKIKMEITEGASKLRDILRKNEQPTVTDKWVEAVENIMPTLPLDLAFLLHKKQRPEMVNVLIKWALFGIDFDQAFEQPLPTFKVRHLKAGMWLVGTLCCCDDSIASRILAHGIQHTLISLYHRPYMTLPVKLLIIRALDSTVRSKLGLELLFGHRDLSSLQEEVGIQVTADEPETPYQRLVKMVVEHQSTRAKIALAALMKKIHTYEALQKLSHLVAVLVKDESNCSASNLDQIAQLLEEIQQTYAQAKHVLMQPARAAPLTVRFQLPTPNYDPYPPLFSMFRFSGLLEGLLVLLSHPLTLGHSGIMSAASTLLSEFQKRQQGLLYLTSQPHTMQLLCRLLLQDGGDSDDGIGPSSLHQLGLHMTYLVQGLLLIDRLLGISYQYSDIDSQPMLEAMTTLYSMIFSPGGKLVVIWLLSQENNLDCILPLLDWKSQPNLRSILKKSACAGYATDLALLTVRFSDHVPLLEKYGEKLLQIVELDEKSRLGELRTWLLPAREVQHFTVEGIIPLCELIRKNSDEVLKFPGELITGLRLLCNLGVSPGDVDVIDPASGIQVELRYKYCILQMFSNDMLPVFMGILEKLSAMYEQPFVQSSALVGHHGGMVIAVVKPIVSLVRRILSYVIQCRGTEFGDMTAVPILLRLYSLMCAFPSSAMCYNAAGEVETELVETLLAYTQPVAEALESDQQLEKSPWTQMMASVLNYTISQPLCFMSGLQILTELLPLPLPVHSSTALEDGEVLRLVNSRKLWSAHLHSLGTNIQQLLATLGVSSYPPLLQLLRRVCTQLSDLAAPTSHLVTRAILDAVMGSLKVDSPTAAPTQLLSFFASMLNVPSIRAACLQILRGGSKLDEKYSEVLDTLCALLNRPSDAEYSHCWQIQEAVIAVLGALCDGEVSLLAGGPTVDQGDMTATIMPSREQLMQIVDAFVEHIGNRNNGFASMLQSLRALVLLTDSDFGFYHLVSALNRKPARLVSVFSKLVHELNPSSSDCLSALGTGLELVKLLLNTEDPPENTVLPPRVNTLGPADVRRMLDWEMARDGNDRKIHPIKELHEILQQQCKEEESLENILETCTNFIQNLEQPPCEGDSKELSEPAVGVAESLSCQFSQRAVYIVGGTDGDEERLSPAYWFTTPPLDDDVEDTDQVTVDIIDVARRYLPDLEVGMELERIINDNITEKTGFNKPKTTPGAPKQRITAKKPFVTAMRGSKQSRGDSRESSSNSRGDHFRLRTPNTSRPPSMHVDDFVALESTGHQPTGPTGYNPNSKRALKELHSRRGRRGRGSDRGRYFGSYGRREGSRGGSRTGAVGSSRLGAVGSSRTGSRSSWGGSRGGTPAARRNRGGAWTPRNKDKDRFGGTPPSRGRRDQRHQRAFTR